MTKKRRPPTAVTENDARAALKISNAYMEGKKGVTYKDATAALKTINSYTRQREAQVRAEAKRLGVKGSSARKLLNDLLNEPKPKRAQN
jgi:hypothetical protein